MKAILSDFKILIFCPNCDEPVRFWETLKTQCFSCLEIEFKISLNLEITNDQTQKKEILEIE